MIEKSKSDLLGFLGSLLMWSKDSNEKVHLVSLIEVERGQINREWDSFERKKQLQIIERERRGKIIVIFAYPPESIFQIVTADLFTVGSGWFLDSRFYARDISNCSIGSSKRYLERKVSVLYYLLYILGFHLLVSIIPIEGLFWFDYL